jgi:hypothetical protein
MSSEFYETGYQSQAVSQAIPGWRHYAVTVGGMESAVASVIAYHRKIAVRIAGIDTFTIRFGFKFIDSKNNG